MDRGIEVNEYLETSAPGVSFGVSITTWRSTMWGHAENWDTIKVDGDIENEDCSVRYERDGRTLAMVTISRDLESLLAESEMERLVKG